VRFTLLACVKLRPSEAASLPAALLVGMKMDRILRIQIQIIFFLFLSEFSDRIRTIYFVLNSDIHQIWIIEIQL
jgi:hypothetical protein